MWRVTMLYSRCKVKGFSLLEVLLVLAIMATIMVAIIGYTSQKSDEMRRDRVIMQIEQFLNAGLAYYTNFGSWPTTLTDLQGNFLPSGTIKNPWGQSFLVGSNAGGTSGTSGSTGGGSSSTGGGSGSTGGGSTNSGAGSQFSVCTTIVGRQAYAAATVVAGRLPIALAVDGAASSCPATSITACTSSSTACTVVSSVTIPGQNLNNARSINFAGLYHNGACVAAPICPLNMVPTIMVSPVSVSGMNDNDTAIYPISSFTAYAIGTDKTSSSPPGADPYDCNGGSRVTCGLPSTGTYWRVCIRIITQKGLVAANTSDPANPGNPNWAEHAGIILALTRCMPANEPSIPEASGSPFTVFTSD